MGILRSHHCNELNEQHIGEYVHLMGFANAVRNLGGIVFIDLRDHYGITQIVINPETSFFAEASSLRSESVIEIKGQVIKRQGAINTNRDTGKIEVAVDYFRIESASDILPFPVASNNKTESEDTRLKYRYLDLRTEKMHKNIIMRSQITQYIREKLFSMGFLEFQTPILTASSPEGARDYLVPSRVHPGKFYALPQAPQQFKQLLMCSGFDKYFQIAPCFRDEDARADRSPGEFYQIDMEMAYVTQDEILETAETFLTDVFKHFSTLPFKTEKATKIKYRDAIEIYGSDKPDLRFDLLFVDVKNIFINTTSALLKTLFNQYSVLKAFKVPNIAGQSRKFFDTADIYAKEQGLGNLAWLTFKDGEWKGSLAKNLSEQEKNELISTCDLQNGDALIFVIGMADTALKRHKILTIGGRIRNYIAEQLGLKNKKEWAFCWIIDFPFYEWNDEENKVDFSHNPFSMPQGGLEALNSQNPLDIVAYQYDIVLNGVELCSGAIRNHKRDIMQKAFEIVGLSEKDIEQNFPALWNAFSFGTPPHGGLAPGLDRIVMFLLDEPGIREVIAFPLNQKAMDVMMNAPNFVKEKQLKDVHIKNDI